MELRQLRYFKAVVEAGSLTSAAVDLHMSQPPLSLAISKFEAELGVQLLIRTARGVEPTSAGRYLLGAASQVLGELDDIRERLGRYGSGAAGALTLASVPSLMRHRIPMLLSEHNVEYPDVDVRLLDPPPWIAIDMLVNRKVDLAAIMVANGSRFAERQIGGIVTVPWGTAPLVGAFPPGMESELSNVVGLEVFHGATVVLPHRVLAVPSLPEVVEEAFDTYGVVPAEIRRVETIQTSIPLIQAGMAMSILPDPDRASLGSTGLTLRALDPELSSLDVIVLTRGDGDPSPALERLLRRIHGD